MLPNDHLFDLNMTFPEQSYHMLDWLLLDIRMNSSEIWNPREPQENRLRLYLGPSVAEQWFSTVEHSVRFG